MRQYRIAIHYVSKLEYRNIDRLLAIGLLY